MNFTQQLNKLIKSLRSTVGGFFPGFILRFEDEMISQK